MLNDSGCVRRTLGEPGDSAQGDAESPRLTSRRCGATATDQVSIAPGGLLTLRSNQARESHILGWLKGWRRRRR